LAARFAADIKKDFGVDTLVVKLDGYESTFDIEVDGVLLFSLKRDGGFPTYNQLQSEIRRIQPPRQARPWDLFDKDIGRVTDDVARARLKICNGCDRYMSFTHQCRECGCFMDAKVKLPNAYCPLYKWNTTDPASGTPK